ncbi:twitching motility protein PilT [Salinadaptatus halalkaliphilus]|uniref:Twitching motility protein PilT n=1 Tax=Salinadaptatus halalkaliphilus TaxID=2419781 RepID=A0A4V3VL79_9EURY|nr:twitching motility protein PilT [Salinadaptatus halalkaliphilus]THE64617.1 twitching motility protein PilT [Salinadaptatus halalkaliphilus]
MTGDDIPANPSVLNTTVLSNFTYIDQRWVVADLSGICTVPVVHEELGHGVDDHPYLQSALDILDDEIQVVTISDTVANREAVVSDHLDPGEAQAFALADAADGRLLTDDGDARSFAKDQGVTVVGSVGVLLAAIDAGKIDEPTADEWLSTWIDEMGYYVPYQSISDYR